jgi:hypothetical protein
MTPQPPSLAQQIEAVEWASRHIDLAVTRALQEHEQNLQDLTAALSAAVETLKTWEFARETLR